MHPRCENLAAEFPENRYFVINVARHQRFFNEGGYLPEIVQQIGRPDLYFAYGIPIYHRLATVNWFHLSNVLPLATRNIPLSLQDRVKMTYLGWRIRQRLGAADVISAESRYSLDVIGAAGGPERFLSVNGSDDELNTLAAPRLEEPENIAMVLGTYRYKALDDSRRVFEMLRATHPGLRLLVVGDPRAVPVAMRDDPNIDVLGVVPRQDVIARLRRSRFYISTTRIENSYNAAAEGTYLAAESYISDIGPHRELLANLRCDEVRVPGVPGALLHVQRSALTGAHLKRWTEVVDEMVGKAEKVRRDRLAVG